MLKRFIEAVKYDYGWNRVVEGQCRTYSLWFALQSNVEQLIAEATCRLRGHDLECDYADPENGSEDLGVQTMRLDADRILLRGEGPGSGTALLPDVNPVAGPNAGRVIAHDALCSQEDTVNTSKVNAALDTAQKEIETLYNEANKLGLKNPAYVRAQMTLGRANVAIEKAKAKLALAIEQVTPKEKAAKGEKKSK